MASQAVKGGAQTETHGCSSDGDAKSENIAFCRLEDLWERRRICGAQCL